MIPNCEGCLWEFEEALREESECGLHYESVSGRANDVYSLGESEQEVIK